MSTKVLHFSSHYEDCGIAKYQEYYFDNMAIVSKDVKNTFFEYSPYQTRGMDTAAFENVLTALKTELAKYDILHIQHEFGFFHGDQFKKIIDAASEVGKKIIVTYHTSPDLIIIKKNLGGLSPRSIIAYLRSKRHSDRLTAAHVHPLHKVDTVLVHNTYTRDNLIKFGLNSERITILSLPVHTIKKTATTSVIAKALNKQDGDIIYSCVGYLHRFKGVDKAIKALTFLPSHYKLAVLGGVKADSDDQKFYDHLTDMIVELNLKDRVYITGVVLSDDDLNSYIRETDISVYPYDSQYYKGVSSGALSLAIANDRPIVAYPVSTFVEMNTEFKQLTFTQSDSYYELAREIQNLDITESKKRNALYTQAHSSRNASEKLITIYNSL
jgi:glycosyltransferase involved in cell wall biosynthesis